jgi:hypothetical protein
VIQSVPFVCQCTIGKCSIGTPTSRASIRFSKVQLVRLLHKSFCQHALTLRAQRICSFDGDHLGKGTASNRYSSSSVRDGAPGLTVVPAFAMVCQRNSRCEVCQLTSIWCLPYDAHYRH